MKNIMNIFYRNDNVPFQPLVSNESTEIELNDYNEEPHKTILSFHELNYTIKNGKNILSNLPFCGGAERKQILFNVSGTFTQGMNAILGNEILY